MKQCVYMRVSVCGGYMCMCVCVSVCVCVCVRARAYVIVHAFALKSKLSRSFLCRSEGKCIF